MQSAINSTNVPLREGAIFVPSGIDDVLNYDKAYYTIDCDRTCAVQFYCTNDKQNYNIIDYNYTPASVVVNSLILQQRYIYVTIRNSDLHPQTYLNFTMLYKP